MTIRPTATLASVLCITGSAPPSATAAWQVITDGSRTGPPRIDEVPRPTFPTRPSRSPKSRGIPHIEISMSMAAF